MSGMSSALYSLGLTAAGGAAQAFAITHEPIASHTRRRPSAQWAAYPAHCTAWALTGAAGTAGALPYQARAPSRVAGGDR